MYLTPKQQGELRRTAPLLLQSDYVRSAAASCTRPSGASSCTSWRSPHRSCASCASCTSSWAARSPGREGLLVGVGGPVVRSRVQPLIDPASMWQSSEDVQLPGAVGPGLVERRQGGVVGIERRICDAGGDAVKRSVVVVRGREEPACELRGPAHGLRRREWRRARLQSEVDA